MYYIKNNFLKIKKYYFNIFFNKKYFKPSSLDKLQDIKNSTILPNTDKCDKWGEKRQTILP
jgi:hypothetical protein